jgi:hypothetical protein
MTVREPNGPGRRWRDLVDIDGGLTVLLDQVVEVIRIEEEPSTNPDARNLPLRSESPDVTLPEPGVGPSTPGVQ